MVTVSVLRMGHRAKRDKRVTTHVFLAARALGTQGGILCGEEDGQVLESVRKVASKWGGKFHIAYSPAWKREVVRHKKNGFTVVHLTMYGERLQDRIGWLRKKRRILAVVGAEKMPAEAYALADVNLSVTSQPHSEVAALAVFLHELFEGKELERQFRGGNILVKPSEKGKNVMSRKEKGLQNRFI